MSDFRFGTNDYHLNIDWDHQAPDFCFGWDGVDWNRVEWVEIDNVKFVKEPTCHIERIPYAPGEYEGHRCSECGVTDEWFDFENYCPNCGAKVVD